MSPISQPLGACSLFNFFENSPIPLTNFASSRHRRVPSPFNPSSAFYHPYNTNSPLMALDVLPSCSTHGSQLLDQLSARFTAASLFTGLRSSASSLCSSSSASGCGTGTGGGQSSPPSSPPPPMGGRAAAAASVNHHFSRPNGASRQFDTTSNEFRYVQNAMAMAVLVRLHRWCCQLFWLTIVCLVGYCSDQQQRRKHRSGAVGSGCGAPTDLLQQQQHGRRTFHEVRKSIVHATQRRGTKTVTELEMQLLRHLTCPQTAVLRPLRPSQHKKRHFLSRPPSPQLFDISEENEQ
ncbi:hypothetical protein GPALN_004961 [Globodera pallida]|nr:hypothetical protein GPALN_004961 [Globodera pallida]